MSITEQIITNHKGKAIAVQFPVVQYKKFLHLAEEMEEIKVYDKAMKCKPNFIPFNQAVKQLKTPDFSSLQLRRYNLYF